MNAKNKVWMAMVGMAGSLVAVATLVLMGAPALAESGAGGEVAKAVVGGDALGWGLLAAALSTGLAALGAGIAVSHVGSAAVGAVTEKPELLGRVLILVGLAEGIAIYGLIISILILNRLG